MFESFFGSELAESKGFPDPNTEWRGFHGLHLKTTLRLSLIGACRKLWR